MIPKEASLQKLTCVLAYSLVFSLFAVFVFAQGGPPPKVKEKIGRNSEAINPFLTNDEIAARFEKDLGMPRDVYEKIKADTASKEAGESTHDNTEKPGSEAMLTMIATAAKVTAGEKNGRFKPEDRKSNLLAESKAIIDRRKAHSGWGGIAEESGLEDPGQLFAIQRAIEFGQPFTPDVAKKLAPTAPQSAPAAQK